MNIELLIETANFSDYDRDSGTGGFCAMFALALYRAVMDQNPELVLVCGEKNGQLLRNKKGEVYWRHAAAKVNGRYYDIEGEQQPEWMIDNYVWGLSSSDYEGVLAVFSPEEFIHEIRSTPSARDWRFYNKCKTKLERARSLLDRS